MKTQKKIIPCKRIARKAANLVSLYNSGHHRNARKQVGIYFINSYWLRRFSISLFLLYALAVGSDLRAQDTPKWEVGTDLLWLIGKNSLPEYSILVRRKLSEQNVLRTRVGISSKKTQGILPQLDDTFSIMIRMGYERNISFNENFYGYYGAEAFYQRNKKYLRNPLEEDNSLYLALQLLNQSPNSLTQKGQSIGVTGIGGLKYHFNDHLSCSIEANINVFYEKTNLYALEKYWRSINNWNVKIVPISAINLSVHF